MTNLLRWHLKHNIYPPIEDHVMPYITQAIDACNRDDDWFPIESPSGEMIHALEMIDDLRLWDFVKEGNR